MIANDDPLDETARQICISFEALAPGLICTLATVDRAGLMHQLAAPSLPAHYGAALDGVMIGPEVGSCGTAAYRCEAVFVENIAKDVRFAKIINLFNGLGVAACWSFPVTDADSKVIGVLAAYCPEQRCPDTSELELAKTFVDLCATALLRHLRGADRERQANIDSLTGLPNRAAFDAALARIPCDEPGTWGIFVLDLDNLKIVNDTFGHLAGDALICAAADRIARVMVPDVTFRLGGDEFAIIIQEPGAITNLEHAAERIFRALEAPAICEGHAVIPRTTIGSAVLGPTEATALAVSEAADLALYHAKETGRGCYVRYWPGIGTRIMRRRDSIRIVAQALNDDRVAAHYQPIVRLETGEITAFEALARLRTLDGKLLSASEFQDATTDALVATELTGRMLAMVARDIRQWLDIGLPVRQVGINVSMADFYSGSLVSKIQKVFGHADVPLNHLMLEVGESVYFGQRDQVVAQEIEALRAVGVQVALDDFGTGYASLVHLVSVPVDVLKINHNFIARLWQHNPSRVIVEGLVKTASRLGISVIAQGIETEMQANQLRAMGCILGQGFVFGCASNREDTAALLHQQLGAIARAATLHVGRTTDAENLANGEQGKHRVIARQ